MLVEDVQFVYSTSYAICLVLKVTMLAWSIIAMIECALHVKTIVHVPVIAVFVQIV